MTRNNQGFCLYYLLPNGAVLSSGNASDTKNAYYQLGDRAGEYYQTGRERAGESYEATRGRATELYSQAADKVTEVAQNAREAASRQTNTVAAAIDAGKKAYQDEKRKTEMSGRLDAAPNYGEKSN